MKRFLIGRGDDCHMRPKSEAISRNHCAILINEDDDEVVIRDLNSRNGTFLNGERLAADQSLEAGDHLQIGRLEFEVMIKDRKRVPEPAVAPAKPGEDSASLDFDINEWLHETDTPETVLRKSDPDTRQFKLDETDRIALEAPVTVRQLHKIKIVRRCALARAHRGSTSRHQDGAAQSRELHEFASAERSHVHICSI